MERVIVKGMYVAGCCTVAAWLAAYFLTDIDGSNSNSSRIVGTVGGVLLFTLLMVAFWLGTRGKLSASWLTLAYGSAMTTHIMLFLGTLSLRMSEWQNPWVWITLAFIVSPCVFGGRVALRGQWKTVLPWWLGSFFALVPNALWVTFR